MIKLKVKDYCHGCVNFSPEVYPVFYANNVPHDQIVVCEHRDECERIEHHLRKEIKKEKENEKR